MVDKDIDVIYRPWEEKEENLRYKEERKKAEKAAEIMESGIYKESKETPTDDKNNEEVDEKNEE